MPNAMPQPALASAMPSSSASLNRNSRKRRRGSRPPSPPDRSPTHRPRGPAWRASNPLDVPVWQRAVGTGAAYLDGLRMDAEEPNAAYEDIAASGLRSLNDGLTEAIMGSKSLGDVFKNVANQIIADLIRIAVQQAIVADSGGPVWRRWRWWRFLARSAISSISGLFGRAGGGYVHCGQMYRVNEAASAGRVEAFVLRAAARSSRSAR